MPLKKRNQNKKRETVRKKINTRDRKNNTGNAWNKGQSKTSSHMPTTMDSSYTAASSKETVLLKDMAYTRKHQSHSTKTYERKQPWNQHRNRRDYRNSRNENTTENIPVHRNERHNERRSFYGRNNVCNINGTTYLGRNDSHHVLGGGKPSQ